MKTSSGINLVLRPQVSVDSRANQGSAALPSTHNDVPVCTDPGLCCEVHTEVSWPQLPSSPSSSASRPQMSLSDALLGAFYPKGDRHRAGKTAETSGGWRKVTPGALDQWDGLCPCPGKEGHTAGAQLKFCSYVCTKTTSKCSKSSSQLTHCSIQNLMTACEETCLNNLWCCSHQSQETWIWMETHQLWESPTGKDFCKLMFKLYELCRHF